MKKKQEEEAIDSEEEAETETRGEREPRFFKKKIVRGIMAFSQQLLGAPAKLLGAPSSPPTRVTDSGLLFWTLFGLVM